jgi:hypothetical protein
MAIERGYDKDTKEVVNVKDLCERCRKRKAKHLVDIHAAVKVLGVRLCGVCCHTILKAHPASSAVNLQKYEGD